MGHEKKLTEHGRRFLEAGVSTTFLIALLMYTFSVIFHGSHLAGEILVWRSITSLGDIVFTEVNSMGALIGHMSAMSSLFVIIPSLLICIGMWLFFGAAKNEKAKPSTGLKLVKYAVIAQYFIIIPLLAVVISTLIRQVVTFERPTPYLSQIEQDLSQLDQIGNIITQGGLLLTLALSAALVIMMVFHFIAILKTVRIVIHTLDRGTTWGCIPAYLLVFNFIFAVGGIVPAFVDFTPERTPLFIASVCGGVSLLLITKTLYSVRDNFIRIKQPESD